MIVEANAHLDLLAETLAAADSVTVTVEEFNAAASVPLRSVFWAHGGSARELAGTLSTDATVEETRLLSTVDGAGLYRTHHATGLAAIDMYEAVVVTDVLLLDAVGTDDGWSLKLWVPDPDSLSAFRRRCSDGDVRIDVRSMYSDDPQPVGELYGLTEPQREILLQALEDGYFNIPRDASLSELAGTLGLSSQAASERLRRGMETLVGNVLDEQYPATRRDPGTDGE